MVFEYRLEHGAQWAAIRIDQVRDLIHTVGLTARFGRYEGAGLVAVGTRR